jgi:hypothetical protein
LRLKKSHSWKAPHGYKIFVAGRGDVRFNFPQDWIVEHASDCVKFHDRQPPADSCTLAVSLIRLPPIDWSGMPLPQLVQTAIEGDKRTIFHKGEIIEAHRPDIEVAWIEARFLDPTENREAFMRLCLARGANIQSLITFDYWADDAARLVPVWDEVIRSLQLGRYVKDPTRGDIVH